MCQVEDLRNAKRANSPTDIYKGEDIAAQIMKEINEEENDLKNTQIND